MMGLVMSGHYVVLLQAIYPPYTPPDMGLLAGIYFFISTQTHHILNRTMH